MGKFRSEGIFAQGFAMNDDLLKKAGGGNYFDEMLERIRDIRSSEKVFWRKVLDIYATSMDYDPSMDASVLFFQDRSKQNALGCTRPNGCRKNIFQCRQLQTEYGPVFFQRKSSNTIRFLGGKKLLQSGRTGSAQWNCFCIP